MKFVVGSAAVAVVVGTVVDTDNQVAPCISIDSHLVLAGSFDIHLDCKTLC